MSNLIPNLGLSGAQMETAIGLLEKLLADEVVLRVKLQKYHWNVTGPEFHELHETFEDQYTDLAPVVDDAAERIRQYGAIAIGTLAEFLQHTRLQETPGSNPDTRGMISDIVHDHEHIIRSLRADIATAQADVRDIGLEDFFTGLLQTHQKMAWLLRARLESPSV
jgi:starvation-inducible DNA-binding protein